MKYFIVFVALIFLGVATMVHAQNIDAQKTDSVQQTDSDQESIHSDVVAPELGSLSIVTPDGQPLFSEADIGLDLTSNRFTIETPMADNEHFSINEKELTPNRHKVTHFKNRRTWTRVIWRTAGAGYQHYI